MNYVKVFETMVQETQKYLEDHHLCAMILGISGGIDSTITAAICSEVERRNPELKFFGVSLPCSSNKETENESAEYCMRAFCKDEQWWTENLQKEYMLMKATCSQRHSPTTIGMGNIKARLRMIYLYDLANYTSGIVMDTDNLTEHYLGFFTIHGDVCDLNPIGGLWKHEVYELAQWIRNYYHEQFMNINSTGTTEEQEALLRKVRALDRAIGIMPTDGNGVNQFGDMGQIAPAFIHDNNIEAYTKVDDIIKTYIEYRGRHPEEYQIAMNELRMNYDIDNDIITSHTVDDVTSRIKRTEYKRKGLPIVIPREKYL